MHNNQVRETKNLISEMKKKKHKLGCENSIPREHLEAKAAAIWEIWSLFYFPIKIKTQDFHSETKNKK